MAINAITRDYPEIKAAVALPKRGKDDVLKTMAHLSLHPEEYFVIGGANLVLREIVEATVDVDMLVHEAVFDWLKGLRGAELHDPPQRARQRGADNLTVWVSNARTPVPVSATTSLGDGYYPMSFESHLEHTEIVEGVNCLELDLVLASKRALQRPKDLVHLDAVARQQGVRYYDLPFPTVQDPYPDSSPSW